MVGVDELLLSKEAQRQDAMNFDEQERHVNRERILWALKQCNGVKRDAAKLLEMSHSTLYARMKEYDIPYK